MVAMVAMAAIFIFRGQEGLNTLSEFSLSIVCSELKMANQVKVKISAVNQLYI